MKPLVLRVSGAALACCASGAALAHGGHGAASAGHWHATDTLGFVLVAVLAGAAIWLTRRE